MIHIDKDALDKRTSEVVADVKQQEIRSSAWIWMGLGALGGLVLSCIKFKKREVVKPVLGSYTRKKGL